MRQKDDSEVSISLFLFLEKLHECIIQADEWKKERYKHLEYTFGEC